MSSSETSVPGAKSIARSTSLSGLASSLATEPNTHRAATPLAAQLLLPLTQAAHDVRQHGRPPLGLFQEALDEAADQVLQLLAALGGNGLHAVTDTLRNPDPQKSRAIHPPTTNAPVSLKEKVSCRRRGWLLPSP